jgi:hypothetical protein
MNRTLIIAMAATGLAVVRVGRVSEGIRWDFDQIQ